MRIDCGCVVNESDVGLSVFANVRIGLLWIGVLTNVWIGVLSVGTVRIGVLLLEGSVVVEIVWMLLH